MQEVESPEVIVLPYTARLVQHKYQVYIAPASYIEERVRGECLKSMYIAPASYIEERE